MKADTMIADTIIADFVRHYEKEHGGEEEDGWRE